MAANTVELRAWLRERRGLELADYEALRRWSVDHVADFWQALWEYFDIASPTPHRDALVDAMSKYSHSACQKSATWSTDQRRSAS